MLKKTVILLLVFCFLCSCSGENSRSSDSGTVSSANASTVLSIYAEKPYRTLLSKTIRDFEGVNTGLTVSFVSDSNSADIVLSSDLRCFDSGKAADLTAQYESYKDILLAGSECRLSDSVIGLPLFLETYGLWYDHLYFERFEKKVPIYLDSLIASGEKITVSDRNVFSIFRSIIAPVVLSRSSGYRKLFEGDFSDSNVLLALQRIEQLRTAGCIEISANAESEWIHYQRAFLSTDYSEIQDSRDLLPNDSYTEFLPSIFLSGDETAYIAAGSVCIFALSSPEISLPVNRFLSFLYQKTNLEQLVKTSQMPLSCRIDFSRNELKDVTARVYNTLSSSEYVLCVCFDSMNQQRKNLLSDCLSSLLNSSIDSDECYRRLCEI